MHHAAEPGAALDHVVIEEQRQCGSTPAAGRPTAAWTGRSVRVLPTVANNPTRQATPIAERTRGEGLINLPRRNPVSVNDWLTEMRGH
ncbi:MAG: hypothetical protein CM1200mP2_21540 [Planctomycetaceae bacterium]|nr:MAG: hypothetical protein CM1200mP2_21540 [Planctomycetaceae bacterium]